MSLRMPFVYPRECNTPSMFVPFSSCRLTRNLPMSSSFTPGGSAPRDAARTSPAVTSPPKTNHGERMSGKNRCSASPAKRSDSALARTASRPTHADTNAQSSPRRSSESSWYRPWSRMTICGSLSVVEEAVVDDAAPASRSRTYTLPACGSPWTNPSTKSISEKTLESVAPTLAGSNPASRSAFGSLHRVMSGMNSVVRTRLLVHSRTTLGATASRRRRRRRFDAHRSALFASPSKSSSAVRLIWKSRTSQERSNPPGLICWPNMAKTAKSLAS